MSERGVRASRRAGEAAGLWPPPAQAWAPAAALLILHAAHLAYGAVVGDAALAMDLAAGALLGAILLTPALRQDLLRLRGLELPGLLFLLVLAIGAWSLTPWVPGGPHPVWTYVGLKGGATVDRSATTVELVKLMGLGCFFLLGAAAGARDERARFAARATVLAGALFGLWAIFAAASGGLYQTQGRRLEALFLNPNTAGNLFAALFVLAVAVAWRQARGGRGASTYAFGAAAIVLAVTLLNTGSRGAVVAALAGLLILFALRFTTGSVKPGGAFLAAVGSVVLLAAIMALAGDRIVDRFFRAEADAPVRYAIWEFHWRAFLDSPLLGYGLGTFEPVNRTLLTGANFETLANLRAPLNLYLQWLEEAGLLGAAPMFLCVAAIMLGVLRGVFRRSRMTGLIAGLLALDVVFVVHGLTDSALQSPSIAAFWAWTLGLQAALVQGGSRTGESAPMNVRRLRTLPAGGLAVSTAGLALICLVALNDGGEARLGPIPLVKLAAGYARPAERLLADPAPSPDAIAEAERLSRRALAQFPYDDSSWLRLAYAERLRHGRLTPQGVALLRRSYDLAPIDIYAGVWRISFVLENSQSIPRDVRQSARHEFGALWRDYRRRGELLQMVQTLRSPAGRLSAALWLNRLENSVAK